MLLLWILQLVIAIVLLEYVYLFITRAFLVARIKSKIKKQGSIKFCRNYFASIFVHDGNNDFILSYKDKIIAVSVLTTPFRRVRYHFNNNELLEIIVEKRGLYVTNPKSRSSIIGIDRSYTIRKYKIKSALQDSVSHMQRYIILNPTPAAVSKVEGATFSPLYNGDALFVNARICSLKYFLDKVINIC